MKRLRGAIDANDLLVILGLVGASAGLAWIDWRSLVVFYSVLVMVVGMARTR